MLGEGAAGILLFPVKEQHGSTAQSSIANRLSAVGECPRQETDLSGVFGVQIVAEAAGDADRWDSFGGDILASSIRVTSPAQMALLASCSIRISLGIRATGSAMTKLSSSRHPLSSRMPFSSRQATASTRPLPQIPTGGPFPRIWAWSAPSDSVTLSMAPSAPRIPMEIPTPSKAGPAAVEQTVSFPSCHRAISPLVPMPAKRAVLPSQSCVARIAQVMSAPTKAEIQGGR